MGGRLIRLPNHFPYEGLVHPTISLSTYVQLSLGGEVVPFPIASVYPDAPCREYLPTCPLECGHFFT